MSSRILSLALIACVLLYTASASAATYVSDELSVNMRGGPGYKYSIDELVKSGTKLDVLSQSNGWTRVRTPSGEVGYILNRLLTDEPAARDQVAALKKRVTKLEKANKALHKELSKALGGGEKLGKLKRELIAKNKQLKSEMTAIKRASKNAVKLRNQNQKFREKILTMKNEIKSLQHKNKALESRREGMTVGAFILVIGILIGIVLPMLRRRKSNNWGSL